MGMKPVDAVFLPLAERFTYNQMAEIVIWIDAQIHEIDEYYTMKED